MKIMLTKLKNHLVIFLLGLMVMFFSSGCFKYPEIDEIKHFEIGGIKDSLLEVNMIASIKNPNVFGATLSKIESKIFIDEDFIGTGQSNDLLKIKASDTSSISMNTYLEIQAFSKMFKKVLSSKGKSKLKIDGKYWVKVGYKSFEIDLITEEEMDLKSQIKKVINGSLDESTFNIKKITPSNVSFTETKVKIDIEVKNPFPIDLRLEQISLKLFMGDSKDQFGIWNLSKPQNLKPNEKAIVTGEVKIGNTSVFGSMAEVVFGKKKNVVADGKASVSVSGHLFKVPIRQEVELTKVFF